ncbi:hypothetical protein KSS94_24530 [Pseudomonas fakonensis]|uniref:DUF3077 domain-containing protein n=1 Tax=Pseudomonas fakonensis TaxID=2842355 RepID=A0ABX8N418_9PSED|nr:hypothetical protein [Pseudomonas fakonensis]QXH51066.1 hypothetical protein KSS94_24530 [Pseudomonas fakonensis]
MLKIVPDPPLHSHSLEDTLVQASEYVLCALTVAHQAVLHRPRTPATVLMMASMHEMESLQALLELALAQVQMPQKARVMH